MQLILLYELVAFLISHKAYQRNKTIDTNAAEEKKLATIVPYKNGILKNSCTTYLQIFLQVIFKKN